MRTATDLDTDCWPLACPGKSLAKADSTYAKSQTFLALGPEVYTVEIDGGSGDASIVATLKKSDDGDDGDAKRRF